MATKYSFSLELYELFIKCLISGRLSIIHTQFPKLEI